MNVQQEREIVALYERDQSLSPKAVVDAARDPKSALHDSFQWDDSKAGEAFRLDQARRLIRVAVTIIPKLNNEPVRTYVSVSSERNKPGQGSYIAMVDVVSDEERYAQVRDDAFKTMAGMQRRFNYVRELQPVWDALAFALSKVQKDAA